MSKELIEKLREDGKFLGGNFGNLMREAADALEAKAAPVGDTGIFAATSTSTENAALHAAHQRQQAREVVMPGRKPIEALDFNRTTADALNEGWNACLDELARLNGKEVGRG